MRIMISCGEASGDLYAGGARHRAACSACRTRRSSASAARGCEAAGGELVGDFTRFSVTGLTEALRVRAALVRDAAAARQRGARSAGPTSSSPIDFPDFNFRLMAALRRLGIPVVYYVSPQLWAWRPGAHGDDEGGRRSRAA